MRLGEGTGELMWGWLWLGLSRAPAGSLIRWVPRVSDELVYQRQKHEIKRYKGIHRGFHKGIL